MLTKFPRFKGHEGCAEIVQIGDQVKDAGFSVVGLPELFLEDILGLTT